MKWIDVKKEGLPKEETELLLIQLFDGRYTSFEFASFYDGDSGWDFYGGRNGDEGFYDVQIVAYMVIEKYEQHQNGSDNNVGENPPHQGHDL